MCRTLLAAAVLLFCFPQATPAQVKLESKYQEGMGFQVEVEVKAHQILTIAGSETETSSTTSMVTDVEVGRRGDDGTLRIRERVTQLRNEASLPGGIKLSFDSNNPDKKAAIPQLETVLDLHRATLKNTTIKILDQNNVIQAVEVTKEVVDAIDQQFRDQFDSQNLKSAATQEANQFPREPVKVGDTWERTEVAHLGAGATLTLQKSYEYTGTVQQDGRTLDRIVGTAKAADLKQDAGAAGGIAKSDLSIESANAEIYFDRDLGSRVLVKESFRIKGDLSLMINGMELPGKLDLTLTNKTTRSSLAASQARAAVSRSWTDSTGSFTVEATLVAVKDDNVQLKRKSDGKVISVPLSRLSEADRKFLGEN